MARIGRRVLLGGLVSAVAASLGIATALPSVSADPAPIRIAGTDGDGVNIRPTPDTSQPRVGWMPEGAMPSIHCFTYGEMIGDVSVWFNVSYDGVVGYYASYYDDSTYASEAELAERYGVRHCDAGGAPTETGGAMADSATFYFDRPAAAAWAIAHALDDQPFDAACTWFVSRALWAGGLERTSEWTDAGERGLLWQRRPGTASATAVEPLLDYLGSTYSLTKRTPLDLAQNAVPQAMLGDLIVYDWQGDGELDHIVMVVDIAEGSYPEVAEWGIDPVEPYIKRGWTWSENSQKWLQEVYPGVRAELIHIDGNTLRF